MKVLFTCGGTGGHIYPVLALYQEFVKYDVLHENTYLFIGGDYGVEKDIFPKEGITEAVYIKSRGIKRRICLSNVKAVLCNLHALGQARKELLRFRPDMVISSGGYPAFPVTFWAKRRRVPFYLLEGNVKPGLVNRLYYKSATKVILATERTKAYLEERDQITVIGYPSRAKRSSKTRKQLLDELHLNPWKKVVTVIGGSCGAMEINQTMIDLITGGELPYQIIWATGKKHYEQVRKSFHKIPSSLVLLDYIGNMNEVLTVTDLLVARAGAMTIQEIKEFRLPCILIPYEKSTANHQQSNARELYDAGVAEIIGEDQISATLLKQQMELLLFDEERLRGIGDTYRELNYTNCSQRIYEEIVKEKHLHTLEEPFK